MIRFYAVPSSVMGALTLWFTFEYNWLLFLSIQTILIISTQFSNISPMNSKALLGVGSQPEFWLSVLKEIFPQGNFFSWFPLPFSETEFWVGATQLHPNRDQELMFFLSQETLSILCKLTSSSTRTSFTEQNTPVFSGSGGLWLMKSESFLF